MIEHDSRFYFANLLADVARCVRSAEAGNEERYKDSLLRARRTLSNLRGSGSAYEESLLLLRGLAFAREASALGAFSKQVDTLSLSFAMV